MKILTFQGWPLCGTRLFTGQLLPSDLSCVTSSSLPSSALRAIGRGLMSLKSRVQQSPITKFCSHRRNKYRLYCFEHDQATCSQTEVQQKRGPGTLQ